MEDLVHWFQPLAAAMANEKRPGCEDTKGDAYVGLVRAAQKYDPEKGPFASHAVLWIKQAISRGSGAQRQSIYLPPDVKARLSLVLAARDHLGEGATAGQISDYLGYGWDEGQVTRLLAVPQAISADASSDDRPPLSATLADPDAESEIDLTIDRSDLDEDAPEMPQSLVDELLPTASGRLLLEISATLPQDLVDELDEWLSKGSGARKMRSLAESIRECMDGEAML